MAIRKKVTRKKVKVAETPSAGTATATAPLREEIERRAYEIYLARGGNGGDPQSDWLQAEQELLEEN